MLMPNQNAASFQASQLNTTVEVTSDEDFVQVRFHAPTSLVCYVRAERRAHNRGVRGGHAHVAALLREAASILSVDGFKRLLTDSGFQVVQ